MNSVEQFEAVVSEHYEPLYRFAMSLTRVESDAQDLTQQTFYVWATKGHQLRDISKIRTWLFTTLHRAFLKARQREIRFVDDDLERIPEQSLVSSAELPDRAEWSQVLTALARVDEGYRAAVALFYLEDYPYKDIAAILEVPIGTVKSRIARGVAQLREILLPESFNDSVIASARPEALPESGAFVSARPRSRSELPSACARSGTLVLLASGNHLARCDSYTVRAAFSHAAN
jgi:RNA polymerase sigma-70 factor (ECF subfamily)